MNKITARMIIEPNNCNYADLKLYIYRCASKNLSRHLIEGIKTNKMLFWFKKNVDIKGNSAKKRQKMGFRVQSCPLLR